MDERQVADRVGRVEGLLAEIESLDPRAGTTALAAVQALLDLYGEGLERIVGHVADADDGALAAAFAGDELVSHLLLLHDLHPVPVEERVARALADVRPYLQSHGGDVELLTVDAGVVRVRLQGSCDGCPSSAMTLRLAIEDAVSKAAPDVDRVEADGVVAPRPVLVPLAVVQRPGRPQAEETTWSVAGVLPQLVPGGTLRREVSGEDVLFVRLEADTFAYRAGCPGCGTTPAELVLERAELVCRDCTRRYDVRRAGRCSDEPQLYLEPVPLLVSEAGIVKVALPAAVGT